MGQTDAIVEYKDELVQANQYDICCSLTDAVIVTNTLYEDPDIANMHRYSWDADDLIKKKLMKETLPVFMGRIMDSIRIVVYKNHEKVGVYHPWETWQNLMMEYDKFYKEDLHETGSSTK